MKILHLSDEGLPDWRIEKSALTAQRLGHDLAFAGRTSLRYDRNTFPRIYTIKWTAKARMGVPYYWNTVRKQVRAILNEFRPDIVHAHNIAAAKMTSEFDFPFVYDDHEYWSQHAKLLVEIEQQNWNQQRDTNLSRFILNMFVTLRRALINRYCIRLWQKWEKDIVSTHPTITVSSEIALALKAIGQTEKVFVVPNFPMANETADTKKPEFHERLSSVYAGGDGHNILKYPNRNIDGLTDLFASGNNDIGSLTIIGWNGKAISDNVRYTGFLSRKAMYEEMFKQSVGLLPWKRHWQHYFVSPNKPYEYAHAGLYVLCTSSFKEVRANLRDNCMTFEDYNDLASKLEYISSDMEMLYQKRLKIFEFAHSNLTWEKNEEKIIRCYSLC